MVQICVSGNVYVWGSSSGEIVPLWSGSLTQQYNPPSPYAPAYSCKGTMPTDPGELVFERAGGCGCTSPLKGRNPLAVQGV
jgi:hypothetical protein